MPLGDGDQVVEDDEMRCTSSSAPAFPFDGEPLRERREARRCRSRRGCRRRPAARGARAPRSRGARAAAGTGRARTEVLRSRSSRKHRGSAGESPPNGGFWCQMLPWPPLFSRVLGMESSSRRSGHGGSGRRARLAALVIAAVLGLLVVPQAFAATFTVNLAGDDSDGICDAVTCTLREAVTAANANAGADQIVFNLPLGSTTISPNSGLPALAGQLTIDGTTQPGYASGGRVVVDGSSAGAGNNGFVDQQHRERDQGARDQRVQQPERLDQPSRGTRSATSFVGTNASGTAAVGAPALRIGHRPGRQRQHDRRAYRRGRERDRRPASRSSARRPAGRSSGTTRSAWTPPARWRSGRLP